MDAMRDANQWLERWSDAPYAYLTTMGRRTGQPHRIEIWFTSHDGRMYLLSGSRQRADWVRNLQANPSVTVELEGQVYTGTARVLQEGADEDQHARKLLVKKYRQGDNLDHWGRTALAIVIEFTAYGSPSQTSSR